MPRPLPGLHGLRTLALALVGVGLTGPAASHPHVWITVETTVLYDKGNFTGLHRLEYGLWHGRDGASLLPVAGRLARDVAVVRRNLTSAGIAGDPTNLPLRAHEILEDALRDHLSGLDDQGGGAAYAETYADLISDFLKEAIGKPAVVVAHGDTCAYVIAGACSAVCGVLLTARYGSGDMELGAGYDYTAIAAVLVGGTGIQGGSGSVLRTLAGVTVIAIIEVVLLLRGFSQQLQYLITGIIVLSVIMLHTIGQRQ